MNVRRSALRTRLGRRHADRGFTLVELVIAVALSGVIVGVIVAALITSLNVADTTTNAVRDSTDAGLISAYLYRDAASAGAIDPATARRDSTLGVSTTDSVTGWSGCEQLDSLGQPATLVVRFSWADHHTSALTYSKVVVTYALDDGLDQLTRRICKDATTIDVEVGSSITSATATCEPVAACTGQPTSVLLTLKGSGAGAPEFELTASLRGGDGQAAPDSANSSQVALLALGDAPASPCPNLMLSGTGAITVRGDAFIDGSCGATHTQGNLTTLQPTGQTSSIAGIVDPFFGLISPPSYTCAGINPAPIGKTDADGVVVYPQAVSIAEPLTFEPGRYVFCDGLNIGANAEVTGSDVMFYVHGGELRVDANATVDLAASTTAPYANLLIWVASPETIVLGGGPMVSNYEGLIYAPDSTVQLTSAVAANVGGLIVKDVIVQGPGRARIGLPVPDQTISISPALAPAGQVDVVYPSMTLTASGGTSPSTWIATGLPPGLSIASFDGSNATISGTPTPSGSTSFAVIVTTFDATAAAASIEFTITVAPQLVITGPPTLPVGQVGSTYQPTTMMSSGGTPLAGGPPDYTWSATGLPAGLTINSTTGQITGTPTASGTFSVTVLVTDAMTTANRVYPITIKPPPTLTTLSPLPAGQAGTAYSTIITASGGTPLAGGPPDYTWSATGLPAGLTINANTGEISGRPINQNTYAVIVTVTDDIGAADADTFALTIGPPATALTITGPATLPTWPQNSAYPITPMSAAGGVSPYTWSATGLPTGLAIDLNTGEISGTPTTAGTFDPVIVTVTDLAMATYQMNYTLKVVPPGCPTIPIVGWLAQYYSNVGLTGTSTLCRDDASINFNWGNGKPDPILPSTDNFSVRWTRTQDFAAGSYTFTMGSDDGSRLKIDGVQVSTDSIHWVDQSYPATPPTFTVPLTAGTHTIVMEFYERGGDARATLTWYSCAGPATGWSGEYYTNTVNPTATPTGTPTFCRDDANINFNWAGAPAPGVSADNFSVRWTRTENFTGGNYMFTMGSDAGARLYIDGVSVLDHWAPAHGYGTPPSTVRNLAAGSHTIVMEYYEMIGTARATLTSYSCSSATGWNGEYFSNNSLTGSPTLCRNDASPNFNWGSGIPAPGVPDTNFSVRWTRTQSFTDGNYTFSMGSNDGSRLYIDGVRVIDQWTDHTYPTVIPTITVPLTAGSHTIMMEFYERTGDARATLTWYSCAGPAAGWSAEYFNNTTLTGTPPGTPTLCRDDPDDNDELNFDWNNGAPATGLAADNFSVRWTRTQNFTGGNYTFTMGSDAGARWYLDGALVRDDWGPHDYRTRSNNRTLAAGNHTIVMEYREDATSGNAEATLTWTRN